MSDLESRLNVLEERLKTSEFRFGRGKANEVNYHIFDYDANDELLVRERVRYIENKYTHSSFGFTLKVFDLYDIVIELLMQEGFIDLCDRFEKKKGIHEITIAINEMLKMEEDNTNNALLHHIQENTNSDSIVMIIGVGKVFPFLRSHKVLNNLHQCIDTVPVIMFYPGKYDGGYLSLFSEIKDDNYYRAFRFE